MEIFRSLGVLWIEISKSFRVLSTSDSATNCNLGCVALKSFRIACRFLWLRSPKPLMCHHVSKIVYNFVFVCEV